MDARLESGVVVDLPSLSVFSRGHRLAPQFAIPKINNLQHLFLLMAKENTAAGQLVGGKSVTGKYENFSPSDGLLRFGPGT
jgi:hypothetical protein|tara:strand:- start:286 stop:528 length:243 start_codon:yes stop_codon:yes gene_type:complete